MVLLSISFIKSGRIPGVSFSFASTAFFFSAIKSVCVGAGRGKIFGLTCTSIFVVSMYFKRAGLSPSSVVADGEAGEEKDEGGGGRGFTYSGKDDVEEADDPSPGACIGL